MAKAKNVKVSGDTLVVVKAKEVKQEVVAPKAKKPEAKKPEVKVAEVKKAEPVVEVKKEPKPVKADAPVFSTDSLIKRSGRKFGMTV